MTSKKQLIQKWTTFSWRPPTERRMETDSKGEMERYQERGAGGYRGIGSDGQVEADGGRERNMEEDCQRTSRGGLNIIYFHNNFDNFGSVFVMTLESCMQLHTNLFL